MLTAKEMCFPLLMAKQKSALVSAKIDRSKKVQDKGRGSVAPPASSHRPAMRGGPKACGISDAGIIGGHLGLTLDVTGGWSKGLSPASPHGYRTAEMDPRGAPRGHGLVFYDLQTNIIPRIYGRVRSPPQCNSGRNAPAIRPNHFRRGFVCPLSPSVLMSSIVKRSDTPLSKIRPCNEQISPLRSCAAVIKEYISTRREKSYQFVHL